MNARLHKLARGAEIPNNCDIPAFLESYEQTEQTLAAVKDFIDASRALTSLYRWKEFKTATGTSNVEKHCVRCHATFTDDTNHQRSCVLPHWFESDGKFTGQYLSEDVRVYSYRGRCCRDLYLREVAREGRPDTYYLNLDQIKPHFEGRHTQDIFEADYNRMDVAVCTFDGSKQCISTPVMYVGDEPVHGSVSAGDGRKMNSVGISVDGLYHNQYRKNLFMSQAGIPIILRLFTDRTCTSLLMILLARRLCKYAVNDSDATRCHLHLLTRLLFKP